MDAFTRALALVVDMEGGDRLSLDPDDRGNWTGGAKGVGVLKGTKWGIAAHVFPQIDIPNLTKTQAAAIYRAEYWDACRCGEMPWPVAFVVFDAAVNQGQPYARRLVQSCVGVAADGVLGPRSMAAIGRAEPVALAQEMQAQRLVRYVGSATWWKHGLGWTRRAFKVMTEAVSAAT